MKRMFFLFVIFIVISWSVIAEDVGTGINEVLYPVKYFDGSYCYINEKGEVIIKGDFTEAFFFSEGLARVKQTDSDRYVFINMKGDVVIDLPYQGESEQINYEILGDFHNGLALVTMFQEKNIKNSVIQILNGYGYINREGKPAITALAKIDKQGNRIAEEAFDFKEGFALVKGTNGYGFINVLGEWIIKPTFKYADSFSDGMARIQFKNTEKWGYVDNSGELVIKPSFFKALNFSDSYALVLYERTNRNDNYGYINKKGEVVFKISSYTPDNSISVTSDEDSTFSEGLAKLSFLDENSSYKLTEYIDLSGKVVIKVEEATSTVFKCNRAFLRKKKSSWSIIDNTGAYIMESQYNWIPLTVFENGIAKVNTDNGIAYINTEGKIIYEE